MWYVFTQGSYNNMSVKIESVRYVMPKLYVLFCSTEIILGFARKFFCWRFFCCVAALVCAHCITLRDYLCKLTNQKTVLFKFGIKEKASPSSQKIDQLSHNNHIKILFWFCNTSCTINLNANLVTYIQNKPWAHVCRPVYAVNSKSSTQT